MDKGTLFQLQNLISQSSVQQETLKTIWRQLKTSCCMYCTRTLLWLPRPSAISLPKPQQLSSHVSSWQTMCFSQKLIVSGTNQSLYACETLTLGLFWHGFYDARGWGLSSYVLEVYVDPFQILESPKLCEGECTPLSTMEVRFRTERRPNFYGRDVWIRVAMQGVIYHVIFIWNT